MLHVCDNGGHEAPPFEEGVRTFLVFVPVVPQGPEQGDQSLTVQSSGQGSVSHVCDNGGHASPLPTGCVIIVLVFVPVVPQGPEQGDQSLTVQLTGQGLGGHSLDKAGIVHPCCIGNGNGIRVCVT